MTIPSYATAAEIKAVMPDTSFGTEYDSLFNTLASRASRFIDRVTKRKPGAFATGTAGTVRYFDGSGGCEQWVDEMAAAPSEVAVDESGNGTYTIWAVTDYIIWPYNETPYTKLTANILTGSKFIFYYFPKSVKITAPWGFSESCPDELKQAVITQVVRWFKRGQQGFQDAGAITELGQLRYINKLDPDIEGIIVDGGYVKVTI